MSVELSSTLEFALAYAQAGFRVIPVNGKIPLTPHGAHDATTDEKVIREWWERWPDAGIGMTLNGLVVVDVDPRNGGDVELLPQKLPETCCARTGGGGLHYLYRAHNGAKFPGQLARGIDCKSGAGSYIVVEPSIHPSGERYVWIDESEPWSQKPAEAPEWLAQPESSLRNDKVATSQQSIPEGGRNQTLTSLAGVMRRRGMTDDAIVAALRAENKARCNPPLPDRKVVSIARSVTRYPPAQICAPYQPPANEFESVRTAGEIMTATTGPARYCVGGRVPCGLVIIGGRPKSRKSWYALQLAIAKAAGGRFMRMMTNACRVLYIALEDNDRRMRQRLEFFGLTPETAPANLHLVYEWPTGLEGVEKIERWLAKFPDTQLIIIDILQRFRGPRDPRASAYDSDYTTMGMLHGIAQRHDGLTILVVHHVRKGAVDDPVEALNGTFAIAGAADAYIILRRGGEKDQWIAHIDGRDWESWDHDFLWDFVPQEGWRQLGVSDGVELTEIQKEIVSASREAGSMTPTRLGQLRGISKQSAGEALQAIVAKGAMRVYAGKYYVNGA